MFELVFTADAREDRSPLHRTVADAVLYGVANGRPAESYEVWQVADDAERTRVCLVGRGLGRDVETWGYRPVAG